jgi:hypothetical protein
VLIDGTPETFSQAEVATVNHNKRLREVSWNISLDFPKEPTW